MCSRVSHSPLGQENLPSRLLVKKKKKKKANNCFGGPEGPEGAAPSARAVAAGGDALGALSRMDTVEVLTAR